jgi:dynein intermediate chain 2
VWDLTNPNNPELQLHTVSPVTNLMYNPKLTDQIGGGCYNGLVAVWDVKKGNQPVMVSPVEKSHHDPVTHF